VLAAVAGGKLQGVEAAYLAHKAGWEVLLIDRLPSPPASGLSDSFIKLDITKTEKLKRALSGVDLIIPALEDDNALSSLSMISENLNIPFAFDKDSYNTSSSKIKSDFFFKKADIPAPKPWPEGKFPFIAKPDKGSGSIGIQIFNNTDQFNDAFPGSHPFEDLVLQEYIPGPSFSLEVMGSPGHYTSLQVTDLHMDTIFDCKRVTAPTLLSPGHIRKFEKLGISIAESIKLNGLMDIEVILHDGILKVLEIDARLPSQTPSAVFWSTGINIIERLGTLFIESLSARHHPEENTRGVIFEHISVSSGRLEIAGEHIMGDSGPLYVKKDFFGSDEAITNYSKNNTEWVATLINTGSNLEKAWDKRNRVLNEICNYFNLNNNIIDNDPEF